MSNENLDASPTTANTKCTCPLACAPHEHSRPACVGCPDPINCARHCFNKMGADGKMLTLDTED